MTSCFCDGGGGGGAALGAFFLFVILLVIVVAGVGGGYGWGRVNREVQLSCPSGSTKYEWTTQMERDS